MLSLPPLKPALFEDRLNRFLVRVNIDGRSELAHLHDPGRLTELLLPGAKLYLQRLDNSLRKTAWDIILVKKGRVYVAIYSTLANRLAKILFESRTFPGLKSWRLIRTEPTFSVGRVPNPKDEKPDARRQVQSRFDFELARGEERMLVEVKSVSLVENGVAMFPDAPTVRGRRHLIELVDAVKQGYKASVIFIVTRNDAISFRPHVERDPDFAEALELAAEQGVKIHCFKCDVSRKTIVLDSKIPFKFN